MLFRVLNLRFVMGNVEFLVIMDSDLVIILFLSLVSLNKIGVFVCLNFICAIEMKMRFIGIVCF